MHVNDENDWARLLDQLESSDKRAIRLAVDALVPLARASAELRSQLDGRLAHPDTANRWAVAYVCAQVAALSPVIIAGLLDALRHRDPEIRWAIGLLLVGVAQRDPAMLSALFDVARRGDAVQRRMALYCLRDLNCRDEVGMTAFFDGLGDADPLVRIAAVAGLKRSSAADDAAKAALLRVFLEDCDTRVRSVAAVTLAQIGTPDADFMRALEVAENSDDAQIKKAAIAALSFLKS